MKLSPWVYYVFGLCALFISIAVGLRFFIPNTTEAGYYTTLRDQLQAEADKQGQADRKLAQAQEMVEERAAAWRQIVATRTPVQSVAAGGIDISQNAWQLTVDSRRFRNNVQRALNKQLLSGGVTVVSAPQIPFPDEGATTILANYYNYPAIPFPVVMFNLGTVTVRGTYSQIANHVRAYSRMPNYLAVADGLRLEADRNVSSNDPILVGTYNLSVIGFIRGREVFPAVPEGGAGGAAGGGMPGAGGFGGPPMGGLGMPTGAGFGGGPGGRASNPAGIGR